MRVVGRAVLVACATLGIGGLARADVPPAPGGVALSAVQTSAKGWLAVHVSGPAGAAVTLAEPGAAPFAVVTLPPTGALDLPQALAWRCDRRARPIEADALAPGGARSTTTVTFQTPSCAHRFRVLVRPRTAAAVGRRLTVTVRDGWGTGGTAARACLTVRRAASCHALTVARAGTRVRLTATRAGVGAVALTGTGFAVRERLEIRARHAPLRLLATGDSMIQIIDSLLAQRLQPGGAAQVTSDARISTGISKRFMLDWVAHARQQAAARRPQATVMFIGANDGFPIGDAPCCDARWIAAYAQRVRTMMAAYRRGGAGRVYWLTLPAPRDAARKPIYHAVDVAIRQAAATFAADEVSVIDLVPVFTPGDVYRASIGGQTVRQADGVHLNVAGAKIAASTIIRRLRADGLTP